MAKRIATQLADEIHTAIAMDLGYDGHIVYVQIASALRWLKWAKSIDARMRLDGSQRSKQRKPGKRT